MSSTPISRGSSVDSTTSTCDSPLSRMPPFDDPNADIVLRSADSVDFPAHKLALSLASPFFRSMFSLPQPNSLVGDPDGATESRELSGPPSISMSESGEELERLLRFCYPFGGPPIGTLTEIKTSLELLQKFEMLETAGKLVREALISPEHLQTEPLRVFFIAHRFRLDVEARLAAKHSLRHPIIGARIEEMEHVSARTYHALLEYHQKCSAAIGHLSTHLRWLPKGAWVWIRCLSCAGAPLNWFLEDGVAYAMRLWFIEHMTRMDKLLRVRPHPDTVKETETMMPAFQQASACATCRASVFVDLPKMTKEVLVKEIERKLSEIVLDLTY